MENYTKSLVGEEIDWALAFAIFAALASIEEAEEEARTETEHDREIVLH